MKGENAMKKCCITAGCLLALVMTLALTAQNAPAGKKAAMELYSQATQALTAGDNSGAIALYDQALEDGGLTVDYLSYAYYNRGMAYYRMGDAEQAKKNLTKARELNINDVIPDYDLGVLGTSRHN
jgi:tetratricopeptide (TPR) repeat protein